MGQSISHEGRAIFDFRERGERARQKQISASMIAQDRMSQRNHNSRLKGSVPMKQPTTEEFDLSNRDNLSDDPERIAGYRAVSLAEGLSEGSEAQVLLAWQWLSDHPDVTNRLGGWFRRRVAELRAMDRIK